MELDIKNCLLMKAYLKVRVVKKILLPDLTDKILISVILGRS